MGGWLRLLEARCGLSHKSAQGSCKIGRELWVLRAC